MTKWWDQKKERTRKEVTLETLKQVANSVNDFMKFTGETNLESTGNTVPCLDTQLLLEECDAECEWFQHNTKENEEIPGNTTCCMDEETKKKRKVIKYKFFK